MLDAKLCVDPSLPEGHAVWLALHTQPQGIFLISGDTLSNTSTQLLLP